MSNRMVVAWVLTGVWEIASWVVLSLSGCEDLAAVQAGRVDRMIANVCEGKALYEGVSRNE